MRTSEQKAIKNRNSSNKGQGMHVATVVRMRFPYATLAACLDLGHSKLDRYTATV